MKLGSTHTTCVTQWDLLRDRRQVPFVCADLQFSPTVQWPLTLETWSAYGKNAAFSLYKLTTSGLSGKNNALTSS